MFVIFYFKHLNESTNEKQFTTTICLTLSTHTSILLSCQRTQCLWITYYNTTRTSYTQYAFILHIAVREYSVQHTHSKLDVWNMCALKESKTILVVVYDSREQLFWCVPQYFWHRHNTSRTFNFIWKQRFIFPTSIGWPIKIGWYLMNDVEKNEIYQILRWLHSRKNLIWWLHIWNVTIELIFKLKHI